MKKFIIIIAAVCMTVGLFGTRVSADSYVNQDDLNAASDTLDAINAFSNSTLADPISLDDVKTTGQQAELALDSLANHSFSTKLGAGYTEGANKIKQDASDLRGDVQAIITAADSGDTNAIQTALTSYNSEIDTFNADVQSTDDAVDSNNQHVESSRSTYKTLYAVLLGITVIFSIANFAWAFKGRRNDLLERKIRKRLALLSLAPVIGAAVTFGTYYAASKNKQGGTYFIAYGPIIFGVLAYLRAFGAYKAVHRKNGSSSAPTMPSVPVPQSNWSNPAAPTVPMPTQPVSTPPSGPVVTPTQQPPSQTPPTNPIGG